MKSSMKRPDPVYGRVMGSVVQNKHETNTIDFEVTRSMVKHMRRSLHLYGKIFPSLKNALHWKCLEGFNQFGPLHGETKPTKNVARRLMKECEVCTTTEDLTLDHIIPRSRGGSNVQENLRCLCRSCHELHNTRNMILWKEEDLVLLWRKLEGQEHDMRRPNVLLENY